MNRRRLSGNRSSRNSNFERNTIRCIKSDIKNYNGPSSRRCPSNTSSRNDSSQKYANSYATTRSNQNDETNSMLNSDISFDFASSKTKSKISPSDNAKYQQYEKRNQSTCATDSARKQNDNDYGKSNESSDDTIDNEKNGFENKISADFTLLQFDEEVIEFGVYNIIKFKEQFIVGQSFRIFLSQIHTPFKFWFQLKEHADTIETLMSGLE